LRKEGTLLTSPRTSKRTSKARVWTLEILVLGLTMVPDCNANVQMQCTESEIKIAVFSIGGTSIEHNRMEIKD
jgi:hypothetical protein